MKDPLSLVYEGLWNILEQSVDFTTMVKPGNRIKFSGNNRAPLKEEAMAADYPEVRITTLSSEPHLCRTSNGSSLKKTFAIQVLSGDQRVDAVDFPLEWIIYSALNRRYDTLADLTWKGKQFVKVLRALNITDNFAMGDATHPAIRGWVSVWACEIEMWFQTTDL